MKRNGLRALALASCVVALFSVFSMAVDLDGIVNGEFIEEISKAAGLNLIDTFIADYTVEELTDLAANGYTPGIKLAADRALFKIGGGLLSLIEMTDEELLALAAAGDQDAADAYVFNARSGLKQPAVVEAAIAAATDEALIRAYGKLLGGFYGPGSIIGMKTEAELLVLVEGEDLGLQVAAATALTTYWILNSDLTIPQVESAILGVTLWKPEFGSCLSGFLGVPL